VLIPNRPTAHLPAETATRSTITQIYEGTNQIQRMVMARSCLRADSSSLTCGFVFAAWRTGVRQRHGNRLDADCAPRRGCAIIPVIVIHRQEVRPMCAVPVMGAPLQGTIARLR
jgi:hypothetical protein